MSLEQENERLKHEIERLTALLDQKSTPDDMDTHHMELGEEDAKHSIITSCLSIIVVGASGDLAKKKTFPSLFALEKMWLLPQHCQIVGYARSDLDDAAFKSRISTQFADDPLKDRLTDKCWYFRGQYDGMDDWERLNVEICKREAKMLQDGGVANRLFYLAIPPTVFVDASRCISAKAMAPSGWTRVVVEKPFGRDSRSAAALHRDLSPLFTENQLYRIDHYLGKEMVQNILVMRFSNQVFEPLWNRHHIKSVQITFKEPFGTQGRGGYFDKFGIIRDVMQNHLLQMLSLVAMEAPVSLQANDVRTEKVKLLRCIAPIKLEDTVLGQYSAAPDGSEPGYLDDPQVPDDSNTPTFAACVLHVQNNRWKGVPFVLKCGKALNQRKAEVRIQFHTPANGLFPMTNNELIFSVQPKTSIYLKLQIKKPGLESDVMTGELDLSYADRFKEEMKAVPDAYTRLIYDVMRGDHNLFVRSDELKVAWEIFTPLLHQIEQEQVKPEIYEYGSRGPASADELTKRIGYVYDAGYVWKPLSTSSL